MESLLAINLLVVIYIGYAEWAYRCERRAWRALVGDRRES